MTEQDTPRIRMRLGGEHFARHSGLSDESVGACCSTGCLGTVTDRVNTVTASRWRRRPRESVKAVFSRIGTDALSRDDRTQFQASRDRFPRLKNGEIPKANVRNVRKTGQ